MIRLFATGLAFAASLSPALAHTGIGTTSGFVSGLLHPMTGIDHLLAILAIGILAGHLGGRATWLVPVAFLLTMAVAGIAGSTGVRLPFVEIGIGLSVVALGAAIAFHLAVPLVVALAVAVLVALFHGHAHGVETPENASGLMYGCGFLLATSFLLLAGLATERGMRGLGPLQARRAEQIGGGLMTLAGVVILTGLV